LSPTLIAWGGNLPLLTLTGDTWRLFTAVLLHGGALHLILNMLALAATADRTEDEFGTARMLVIYVVGGVLASCASVLSAEWHTSPGNTAALLTVSVGASGAVMAQFGALLVALVVTPPRFVPLPPDKRPGMDWRLVLIVAANLVFGALMPHVDQAAHVGGLLAGMTIGALMAMVPTAIGARAALARYAATALLATVCVSALLHAAPRQQLLVMRALWPSQPGASH
jgi:rhomboid protease GluP